MDQVQIEDLYSRENRHPLSIKKWLLQEGVSEGVAETTIVAFARQLKKGKQFGFDENGISELSKAIKRKATVAQTRENWRRLRAAVLKGKKKRWYKKVLEWLLIALP